MNLQALGDRPGASSLGERLRVYLLARVLIVSVFLAVAGVASLNAPAVGEKPWGEITFAMVALAYLATVLSAMLVRSTRAPRTLAYLQIVFDVVLITAALGSLEAGTGLMACVFALPIVNAACLLLLRGALAAALLSAVAQAGLVFHARHAAQILGTSPPDLVFGDIVLPALCFVLIALGMGSLARRLALAEAELAESRAELCRLEEIHRALADGIECSVLVIDSRGRVRSANPAAQQILGLPIVSMLGRDLAWLVPLYGAAAEKAAHGEYVECEQRVGAEGVRRLRIGSTTLRDTFGNSIGQLLVMQDITRIESLENRLREAEELASVLPQAQGEVADSRGVDEQPGSLRRIESMGVQESLELDELDGAARHAPDGILGCSVAMREIDRVIDKVAATTATVLITGESGTGKELVARALHRRSGRNPDAFVAVNCGAIPEALIESELFGHVRGAFTGAVSDRPGLFRRAHGGTIFLDEIGELSPALQVRLLRVLQDHCVLPVGASQPVSVDVRVVAATNRVLEELVEEGGYREDLYYRLAVISVELPPLRERAGDLPLLIEHFVREGSRRHDKPLREVSAAAMSLLLRHPYLGNVRELENVIEHAITLADRETLEVEDLPDSVRSGALVPSRHSAAATATLLASNAGLPSIRRLSEAAGPEGIEDATENVGSAEQPPDGRDGASPSTGSATSRPLADGTSLDEYLARLERGLLRAALEEACGVKKKAATLLGINYRSFRHRLQKYQLDSGPGDSGGTLPRS